MSRRLQLILLSIAFAAPPVIAHAADDPAVRIAPVKTPAAVAAAKDMTRAANTFLAALTAEQKAKAVFEFKDDERLNWHFVPRERKGLPIKEMTPAQTHLANALLSSGMGQRGYLTALTIMSLEEILKGLEQGRGPNRDAQMYFFSIFGTPGEGQTWGWRVEGHHLALNFVIVGGKAVAAAPSFFGSNPAEVREGPRKGLRTLDLEEDFGRALVKSLDGDLQKLAIIRATAYPDIITGASRKAKIDLAGVAASKLGASQKQMLLALIQVYAHRLRPELAEQDLKRIHEAGLDKVHFAWAGSIEPGQGHYYRVQGPTFLIEYDNTQNNANHVHAVWRDLENDFGEDMLRKHYEEHHQEKK